MEAEAAMQYTLHDTYTPTRYTNNKWVPQKFVLLCNCVAKASEVTKSEFAELYFPWIHFLIPPSPLTNKTLYVLWPGELNILSPDKCLTPLKTTGQ